MRARRSERLSAIVGWGLGSAAVLILGVMTLADSAGEHWVPQSARHLRAAGGGTAHPTADMLPPGAVQQRATTGTPSGCEGVDPGLPIQLLSPPVAGPLINFESPQVQPLALSADGSTLLVTHTPNNHLLVMDTQNLDVIRSIPTGLEPVSVAFEPNSGDTIAWVLNHVSDNISIVNVDSGRVLDVVGDFDEPVSIVFNAAGSHAVVIVQGRGLPSDYDSSNYQAGWAITIDVVTREIVSRTFLDLHTPRAAVYDPDNEEILVAALHSGNNSTVVGRAVVLETTAPPPAEPSACDTNCNCDCEPRHMLEILRDFSATAALFAADAHLGPQYPDSHDDPDFPPSPLVHRIIPASGGGWQDIVDLLATDDGQPDGTMVDLMNDELGITNAFDVIEVIIDERKPQDLRDVVVLDFSNPADPQGLSFKPAIENVGTTLMGMGLNPANGNVFVSNMEARNLVRHEHNLRGHIVDHQIVKIPGGPIRGAPVAINLHEGIAGIDDPLPPGPGNPDDIDFQEARDLSLANPLAMAFGPDNVGFVIALSVDRVASFNGSSGAIRDRVDVGRGPRGLALDAAGQRLYVMNRTDMSVSKLDVSNPDNLTTAQTRVLFNPEPAEVQDGRHFLYSAKFSDNFASACVTCHIDSHLDHMAWDLSDLDGTLQPVPPNLEVNGLQNHPIKGPMVTLSLKGLQNHEHFHWRSDKPTFQDFSGAFDVLLGGSEMPDAEMDAFTAFIKTVVYPPSPFYNRDTSFMEGALAINGLCHFVDPAGPARCDACHQVLHDGAFLPAAGEAGDGGINISGGVLFAQVQEITQLRELHKKFRSDKKTGFGLIHDGREESEDNENPLQTFLLEFFPGMTETDRLELIAYLLAFQSNVSSTVAWQVQADGDDSLSALTALESDVLVMVGQHNMDGVLPSQADVIAQRWSGGVWQGFFMNDATSDPLFQSDTDEVSSLHELLESLSGSDTILFTAVPPGSGRRMGIDHDSDCLSHGLDPHPETNNAHDSDFNGLVGTVDFNTLRECSMLDGPLAGTCALFDSDCDGLLDAVDFAAFVDAFDEQTPDCDDNGQVDLLDILGGAADVNFDAILDVCQEACPGGVADCADTDGDGLRDDNCVWYACVAAICEPTAIPFADMGGANGACPPDQTADGNDRFHTLNCFSNEDTFDQPGYPCEPNPPGAMNVDAGGEFGQCAPDGVCDGNDAFHVMHAFTGESSCSCPANGPAPVAPPATVVRGETRLALRSAARRAQPGDLIAVDVHLAGALSDVRGYQLHLDTTAGRQGGLLLVDIVLRDRADAVFAGLSPWTAFNVNSAQMVAGLDTNGIRGAAGAYLATYIYRVGRHARGRFTIELLDDMHDVAERTYVFPTPPDGRIDLSSAKPLVIDVESRTTRDQS